MQSKTVLTELETVKSLDTQKPWRMEKIEEIFRHSILSSMFVLWRLYSIIFLKQKTILD